MPASMMGVPFVAADDRLVGTLVAPDPFQFANGINGTGPMGFQSGMEQQTLMMMRIIALCGKSRSYNGKSHHKQEF